MQAADCICFFGFVQTENDVTASVFCRLYGIDEYVASVSAESTEGRARAMYDLHRNIQGISLFRYGALIEASFPDSKGIGEGVLAVI